MILPTFSVYKLIDSSPITFVMHIWSLSRHSQDLDFITFVFVSFLVINWINCCLVWRLFATWKKYLPLKVNGKDIGSRTFFLFTMSGFFYVFELKIFLIFRHCIRNRFYTDIFKFESKSFIWFWIVCCNICYYMKYATQQKNCYVTKFESISSAVPNF